MFEASGNSLRHLTSRLLAVDSVFRGVQRALLESLEVRRALDRNVGRLLAGLNVPSHQEVSRLFDHLDRIDSALAELGRRVNTLAAELEAEEAASPEPPGSGGDPGPG